MALELLAQVLLDIGKTYERNRERQRAEAREDKKELERLAREDRLIADERAYQDRIRREARDEAERVRKQALKDQIDIQKQIEAIRMETDEKKRRHALEIAAQTAGMTSEMAAGASEAQLSALVQKHQVDTQIRVQRAVQNAAREDKASAYRENFASVRSEVESLADELNRVSNDRSGRYAEIKALQDSMRAEVLAQYSNDPQGEAKMKALGIGPDVPFTSLMMDPGFAATFRTNLQYMSSRNNPVASQLLARIDRLTAVEADLVGRATADGISLSSLGVTASPSGNPFFARQQETPAPSAAAPETAPGEMSDFDIADRLAGRTAPPPAASATPPAATETPLRELPPPRTLPPGQSWFMQKPLGNYDRNATLPDGLPPVAPTAGVPTKIHAPDRPINVYGPSRATFFDPAVSAATDALRNTSAAAADAVTNRIPGYFQDMASNVASVQRERQDRLQQEQAARMNAARAAVRDEVRQFLGREPTPMEVEQVFLARQRSNPAFPPSVTAILGSQIVPSYYSGGNFTRAVQAPPASSDAWNHTVLMARENLAGAGAQAVPPTPESVPVYWSR